MSQTKTPAAPTNGAQVPAKQEDTGTALVRLLESSKKQIAAALPKHLTPERMIRMAVTTFRRSPQLHQCDPITIVGCVIQASELGLELSGPLGQAYMIPRWNSKSGKHEATFQIGYRGYVRLAFNSGMVSYFNAHEVREGDYFVFEYGTDQKLRHIPAEKDRGEITAYYSVFRTKDGAADFEVMGIDEMNTHRDRFRSQKKGGPWDDHPIPMGLKTVIRKLAKRAPLSPELAMAAANDEYDEAGAGPGSPSPAALPMSRTSLKSLGADTTPPSEMQREQEEPETMEESQADPPTPAPAPGAAGTMPADLSTAPTNLIALLDEVEILCSRKGKATRTAVGLLKIPGVTKVDHLDVTNARRLMELLEALPDERQAGEEPE